MGQKTKHICNEMTWLFGNIMTSGFSTRFLNISPLALDMRLLHTLESSEMTEPLVSLDIMQTTLLGRRHGRIGVDHQPLINDLRFPLTDNLIHIPVEGSP